MAGTLVKNKYDVIVIGGGAAGMMAAGTAAARGRKVLLLEKNQKLGDKLKITGGGRCNITNAEENKHTLLANYGKAEKFLHSSFVQFGVEDTFSFFTEHGLPLVVQAGKRAFPQTEKATDVLKVLEKYLKQGNVLVKTNCPVTKVVGEKGKIVKIICGQQEFLAESFILATGGKSRPETGSTGDGFNWLATLGHAVKQPTPTIVPLAVTDTWVKELAGVSLKEIKITFFINNKKSFSLKGNILLTHFGLSGPLILNAAGKVADMLQEGEVSAKIDCYPSLDLGSLDKKITKLFDDNKNKILTNVFKLIAPAGTAQVIISLLPEINQELKIHSVTKTQRQALAHLLKALPLTISNLMGYDKAVVADGGLDFKQVNPKTFQSTLYSNLFIIGDLLHISRPSGGYSLQLCWTSGYVAGSYV